MGKCAFRVPRRARYATVSAALLLGMCYALITAPPFKAKIFNLSSNSFSSSSTSGSSGSGDESMQRAQRELLTCTLTDVERPSSLSDADYYRDNLELDFAPWKETGFTFQDFKDFAATFPVEGELHMIQIKNNKIHFVRRDMGAHHLCPAPDGLQDCVTDRMMDIATALSEAMDGGEFSLPDTVFIVNIADVSFCTDPGFVPGKVIPGGGGAPFIDRPRKVCGLPMMTLFKERGERGVLVPEFEPGVSEKDGSDFFGMDPKALPWNKRKPQAFFRGTLNCNARFPHRIQGRDVECSRSRLRNISTEHIDEIDIWTSRSDDKMDNKPTNPRANPALYLPMNDWAEYRHIAHLDGTSGSFRLFKVLAQGSVILKQESRWQQWYYRSIRPCVHYVPFFHSAEDDIIGIVKSLLLPENDRLAQLIGEKGRQFARQWTTRKARLAYWKHAIDRYAELFKDYNSDLNLTALLGNSEK